MTAQDRTTARLAIAFGGVALTLAAIGLYGVLSYGITRRNGEIAIRIALGARPGRVISMILGETAGLVAAGLVVGGLLAASASRLLGNQLYGVEPQRPAHTEPRAGRAARHVAGRRLPAGSARVEIEPDRRASSGIASGHVQWPLRAAGRTGTGPSRRMPESLVVLALGFFLGVRHATDADHVIAVTTIITRQREILAAAVTGLLWGLGHTLTVMAVGSGIILFNLAIPNWLGVGMELSVGLMLVVLGLFNIAAFFNLRPGLWRRAGAGASEVVHAHAHSHGDYVHTHPHGHGPEVHPHRPDQTPLAAIDRRFARSSVYGRIRPFIVGVVHGLAGSAAVTLLVVAAVRDPGWAIAYLLVFGLGTIAGMMLITMSLASAFRLAGAHAGAAGRHLGLAAGVASVVFGIVFAYQIWSSAMPAGQ